MDSSIETKRNLDNQETKINKYNDEIIFTSILPIDEADVTKEKNKEQLHFELVYSNE
jgi:hypothetical protein